MNGWCFPNRDFSTGPEFRDLNSEALPKYARVNEEIK